MLHSSTIVGFQSFVLSWYSRYGRQLLPWRQTSHPYSILVSELMLQQTQVDRVIPKYQAFMQRFPSIEALAAAATPEILQLWQGLGYNRRALHLHATAKLLATNKSVFPQTSEALQSLPGIGQYTASAICAFAFNQPVIVIETNIRAVFLYHFFPGQTHIPDSSLRPHIEQTIPATNAREWYSALMDYGSYLKKALPNPTRQSRHYTKQAPFKGSNRQVRGQIIKFLTMHDTITRVELRSKITGDKDKFEQALSQLIREGFLTETDHHLRLSP